MQAGRGRRPIAHGLILIVAWPLLTIVATAVEARMVPYISVPWLPAFGASAAGVVLLAPDFIVVGAALAGVSVLVFGRWGRDARGLTLWRLCLEPIVMVMAVLCATSLAYPTIFSHTMFVVFWHLPFLLVFCVFVFITISLLHDVAPRGRRWALAIVLSGVGLAAAWAPSLASHMTSGGRYPSSVVVLGIDSLSQDDDVADLRKWVGSRNGAWYERAVAPGLLTNAVWASIVTMQPVAEHGIFHPFQPFPADRARLVASARQAGFHTVAMFSDQLTCAIGSQAGFDEDRSGPMGWRQLSLATVQNSSLLLPLFRPLLPRTRWSVAPSNHAGTFTYDLRREIRDVLTSGTRGQKTLVAAHLTYLHMAAFPRFQDLSWSELWRISRVPVGLLRDRTLDWEYTDNASDPVPLHGWKLARLEDAVVRTVEGTGFLAAGGKLLVFSDHGQRAGLTPENFSANRYHHVVLASIGLPARPVQEPVSLMNIGALLGLAPLAASEPVVEFASPPQALWARLASTARMHWSGSIELDHRVLETVFAGLQRYRPWSSDDSEGLRPGSASGR
jgi:hypothetical protein